MNRKTALFALIFVAASAGLAAYLHHAKTRGESAPVPMASEDSAVPEPAPPAENTSPNATAQPEAAAAPLPDSRPPAAPVVHEAQRIFFRHNGVDAHYGNVAWVDTANLRKVRYIDTLRCEVVHVSGGRGICLSADRGVFTTYAATLFDATSFAARSSFPLKGIPSRARVSADGRLAAFTVFVSGHGYTTLDFSTQTLLIDLEGGAVLADLETFEVTRDGAPIKSPDFNFWGVTFTADAKVFYATLSTGGQHFLVRGDIAARTAEVIHENVECPSLSPDARRVAYKKRLNVDNRVLWQLQVLDLASGRETSLSERRSIDDQLEWLDSRHVLYSVPSAEDGSSPSTDVWQVAVDGTAAPRIFLRNAYSPATVRCAGDASCGAGQPQG